MIITYDSFQEFLANIPTWKKREVSEKTGISMQYLSHVKCGQRKPGVAICARVMKAYPEFTLQMMRPDLFDLEPEWDDDSED